MPRKLAVKSLFKIELLIIYVAVINFAFTVYFKSFSNNQIIKLDTQLLTLQQSLNTLKNDDDKN